MDASFILRLPKNRSNEENKTHIGHSAGAKG
jgi:hypothetical protein